jgi:hypothetical protein
MQRLAAMEKLMLASPDQQISLSDPDSRSMATSGRGSGVVGYNVQVCTVVGVELLQVLRGVVLKPMPRSFNAARVSSTVLYVTLRLPSVLMFNCNGRTLPSRLRNEAGRLMAAQRR